MYWFCLGTCAISLDRWLLSSILFTFILFLARVVMQILLYCINGRLSQSCGSVCLALVLCLPYPVRVLYWANESTKNISYTGCKPLNVEFYYTLPWSRVRKYLLVRWDGLFVERWNSVGSFGLGQRFVRIPAEIEFHRLTTDPPSDCLELLYTSELLAGREMKSVWYIQRRRRSYWSLHSSQHRPGAHALRGRRRHVSDSQDASCPATVHGSEWGTTVTELPRTARYLLVAAFQLLVHRQDHSIVVCAVLHSTVLIHYAEIYYVIDHRRSGVVCNFKSVCLSVCVCQTITFERQFIFAHPVYLQEIRVKFVYESHRVKAKVTGAKKVENPYSRNVKPWLAITPFLPHRAVKFACGMGFSDMADRMAWLTSSSRDQKWPRVTKCTHSRVVGLRLEGSLV